MVEIGQEGWIYLVVFAFIILLYAQVQGQRRS